MASPGRGFTFYLYRFITSNCKPRSYSVGRPILLSLSRTKFTPSSGPSIHSSFTRRCIGANESKVDPNEALFRNVLRSVIPVGAGIVVGCIAFSKMSSWKSAVKLQIVPCVNASGINDKENIKQSSRLNFIADAVEKAAPAVVNIEVTSTRHMGFFKHTGPTSSGSGFVVTKEGMVLTNAHVVADAMKVDVKLPNGEKYEGMVVDIDQVKDLAAIQLIVDNKKEFPYLEFGSSSKVRAGEWVAALGSPLQLSNTITAGIVSTIHRGGEELGLRNSDLKYIQTDAAINVGNSGGPLVNLDGEVIGINCITVYAASGISFAIPADAAKEFLASAKTRVDKATDKEGKFKPKLKPYERFYIGISMLTLTPSIAEDLRQRSAEYANITDGVLVARLSWGSPADKAGLQVGDVIVAINGKNVKNATQVYDAVRKGETLMVEIQRGSRTFNLRVTPEVAGKL